MARDRREYYKQWRAKNASKVKTYNETVRKKWTPLRNELAKLYRDMGRYEEFKPALDRQNIIRDMVTARRAGVILDFTPESVAQFQINKIKKINAQAKKLGGKVNPMGLLYSLAVSDWESEIEVIDNRGNKALKKHRILEVDGEYFGLASGKIRKLEKTQIVKKPKEEVEDTGRYYDDDDDYDDSDTDFDSDDLGYNDVSDDIGWQDGAEGDDWEFTADEDNEEVFIEDTP